jgi:succinyl-CoA synthetase beta subunit
MKIHEYQGKELFKRFGIPVPVGEPALSIDDALGAVPRVQRQSGVETVVVKAQIHAGGRGKGGGVKVCKTRDDAEKAIRAIFGMQLVTAQTGPAGKKVQRLLIEQGLDIAREFYFAITLDRAAGRVTIMASAEGGMDIEEVAAKHPEKIHREPLHPALGFQDYQGRRLGFRLGLPARQVSELSRMLANLSRMYDEMDCALVEVNPLVLLQDGRLAALDAKVTFDDNGLERHPELRDWRDPSEEDPAESEAKRHDLSYINLDGNIGCMVNGAGLAMATMDIIQHYGGRPANFLDVGGGATTEKVTAAFKIITRDPSVKGIFVNIFGGIMKCDTIANGIIAAVKEVGLAVPLVVRLEGTNVELGKKLLQESGLNLYAAADMADGARKIAQLAGGQNAGGLT